ncbi:unnamed protein product [Phytomonas sp. EM1]|nr:unnamed protein product [Phytomonas sp. EM1]|eukprot:CCW64640.1 unnamed protein product [Phytomonas sp. isolate EM1]
MTLSVPIMVHKNKEEKLICSVTERRTLFLAITSIAFF